MLKSIPFTQFLMPNGRKRHVEIERPAEMLSVAEELIKLGCSFEIEMLQTRHVSAEVMYRGEAIACALTENGPPLVNAIDQMIHEAHRKLKKEQPCHQGKKQ